MTRIRSLDLARGFTVLMMAPVHTVLLYSRPEVHDTAFGYLLTFVAEGPGAQLFMFLMGTYCAFQKLGNWSQVIRRSGSLLAAGYALNLLKFVLPCRLGWLPPELLAALALPDDPQPLLQLMLIGDILHFSAPALLVLYGIRRLPSWHHVAILGALLVCFAAPYCWDLRGNGALATYMLSLAGGSPPQVFFPLMPWLVYPLAGLAAGYHLQRKGTRLLAHMGLTGACLLALGLAMRHFIPGNPAGDFYRTTAPETIRHLGIVLLSLAAWHFLEKAPVAGLFFRLLEYAARHITLLYCIQWILVVWLLPFAGYLSLGYTASLIAITCTTTATFAFSFVIRPFPLSAK